MDKLLLNRIMEEWNEFKSSHIKTNIDKKRRHFIKNCYQRLKLLEAKSAIGVHYNKNSVIIRIVAKRLLSCREAPALLNLIGISDVCYITKCRNGFIIDLEFYLWQWKEKEH